MFAATFHVHVRRTCAAGSIATTLTLWSFMSKTSGLRPWLTLRTCADPSGLTTVTLVLTGCNGFTLLGRLSNGYTGLRSIIGSCGRLAGANLRWQKRRKKAEGGSCDVP